MPEEQTPSTTKVSMPGGSPDEDAGASWPVLATLVYYHLFRFPLTFEETHRLSRRRGDPGLTNSTIDHLRQLGVAGVQDGYVFLGDSAQVSDREAGTRRAVEAEGRIRARARLIGGFPFVRGVALSGSASKDVLKPGDDIDFFVITAPERLWLCRTLLMLFKKVFLLNSHRFFCVNYLVSEDRMELPDQNVFTAMEIAWMRPLWGARWYEPFLAANRWTDEYLPNWRAFVSPTEDPLRGWVKGAFEWAAAGSLGDWADEWLRVRILERNRRRYERRFGPGEFDIAFRSERHTSKHHPGNHQGRVGERYRLELEKWRARLTASVLAGGETGVARTGRP